MSTQNPDVQGPKYDRAFLLSDVKRNQVLELWAVQKFGTDSSSDPEYVCIYGMPPTGWYRRGVGLLAHTTLEAVRDKLGALIGTDVESIIQKAGSAAKFGVIDPFAGDRQDDLRNDQTEYLVPG